MSLMSGLYVGTSGLQTSQNALNTTAHNLSNVETAGYTRQQVLQEDRFYTNFGNRKVAPLQTGLGVEYAKVRQVRDDFLDQSYRSEAGRSAFYDIKMEATNELETLLGEFDGVAFQDSLSNLWTVVQELEKDPSSAVIQGSLVATASQFIDRAQAVYDGLTSYQDNLNAQVKDQVKKINDLGNTIYELNIKIQQEEVGNVSEANDLRDQRNQALDELAGLAKISYSTNADGGVEVMIEGYSFVARDRVFNINLAQDSQTGFYTPVWDEPTEDGTYKHPVYKFETEDKINSERNSDIGQLKSLILARGDRRANYTDLENDAYKKGLYPDPADPTNTKEGVATETSIVMEVQAELDNLVHSIVTEINNILTEEKSKIDAHSKDPSNPVPEYSSYDDCPRDWELFQRLGTQRYEDDGSGTYKYVAENTDNPHGDITKMFTLGNIKINPDLLQEPTLLSFVNKDKTVMHDKAEALTDAFSNTFGSLNPNYKQDLNYADYYSSMVGRIATQGSVYDSISRAQQAVVLQVDEARQSIAGVSSNEELSNMIKFQNAFNASSRYINALNSMLEDLLNKLS